MHLHPLWQVPLAQLAYGPSMAPRVLYDPAQQILACSGFRPRPPAIPTCSSYPLPLQVGRVPWPGRGSRHRQPSPGTCCPGGTRGPGAWAEGVRGLWLPLLMRWGW